MGIVFEEYEDVRDGSFYLICADVLPDSQAAHLQLSPGSVLQAIEGVSIQEMSPELAHDFLTLRPVHLNFSPVSTQVSRDSYHFLCTVLSNGGRDSGFAVSQWHYLTVMTRRTRWSRLSLHSKQVAQLLPEQAGH